MEKYIKLSLLILSLVFLPGCNLPGWCKNKKNKNYAEKHDIKKEVDVEFDIQSFFNDDDSIFGHEEVDSNNCTTEESESFDSDFSNDKEILFISVKFNQTELSQENYKKLESLKHTVLNELLQKGDPATLRIVGYASNNCQEENNNAKNNMITVKKLLVDHEIPETKVSTEITESNENENYETVNVYLEYIDDFQQDLEKKEEEEASIEIETLSTDLEATHTE